MTVEATWVRRRLVLLGTALALVAATGIWQAATADTESPPTCAPRAAGQPMFVTADCVDPRFNDAYAFVSVDEVRQAPVPYRFVYGGFRGTEARFAFYFPLDGYKDRFIQGPIHQLRITGEVADNDEILNAFDDGAYLVETNNGGNESCLTARDCLRGSINGHPYDAQVRGYRVAAAAAKFSSEMAMQIYGTTKRPNGIIYGGSGGAYMTISSCEQTEGVWAGCVPFVFGTPDAIPDNFTTRVNAIRVLNERNKFPCIMDAIDAGGDNDPIGSCALNSVEAQAFMEATRHGYPPMGWYDFPTLTGGPLSLVADYVPIADPTYVSDFWSKPGYLGTERSAAGDDVRAARVRFKATVVAAAGPGAVPGPVPQIPNVPPEAMGPLFGYYNVAQYVVGIPPNAFVLDGFPATSDGGGTPDLTGAWLVVESGSAAGRHCNLNVLDASTNLVQCGANSDPDVIKAIKTGDKVRIDNSLFLALQTFHRHQVPLDHVTQVVCADGSTDPTQSNAACGPVATGDFDPDYYAWDQFVTGHGTPGQCGGCKPIYPQRALSTGLLGAYNASGSISTGAFPSATKMIMVESRMDQDAEGWSADWYHRKLLENNTEGWIDNHYRLYINDHAVHTNSQDDPNYVISYAGVLEQALRTLFQWIEEPAYTPPTSTAYEIGNFPFIAGDRVTQAQVQVPPDAADRLGLQPVVHLTVEDGEVSATSPDGSANTITVKAGDTVSFTGTVEAPPGAGKVTCFAWNYEAPQYFQEPEIATPTVFIVNPGSSLSGAIRGATRPGCTTVPPAESVTQTTTHTYTTAGTYYCVLIGSSNQNGDPDDTAGKMDNLARVRVVVT